MIAWLIACSSSAAPPPEPLPRALPEPVDAPTIPDPNTQGTAITGFARISPGIGPSDGGAFDIYTGLATDDCAELTTAPPVRLYLFDGLPYQGTAPWRWKIGPDLSTGAQIQWCRAGADSCVHLVQGAIELATWTEKGRATGWWSGTDPDGTQVHGSFDARFCDRNTNF